MKNSIGLNIRNVVAKIHPQLPLSPRESDRLLGALTGTFRKHLDEAHPWVESERPNKPRSKTRRPQDGRPVLAQSPSLTTMTDRHLASVLTNPLVAAPNTFEHSLNLSAIQAKLEENPDADPIQLLEENEVPNAVGQAAVLVCLKRASQLLALTSGTDRKDLMSRKRFGTRSLNWLRTKRLHYGAVLLGKHELLNVLVRMLVEENAESLVWDWIKLGDVTPFDLSINGETPEPELLSPGPAPNSDIPRLRGLLVRKLLLVRCEQQPYPSNVALETFSKAFELRKAIQRNHFVVPGLNIVPAGQVMVDIFSDAARTEHTVDEASFEQFIATVPLWTVGSTLLKDFYISRLQLVHPTNATAIPALRCLKTIFDSNNLNPEKAMLARRFTNPSFQREKGDHYMLQHFRYMIQTATLLQQQGLHDETAWVVARAEECFSSLAGSVDFSAKDSATTTPVRKSPSRSQHGLIHSDLHYPTFG